MTKVCKYFFCVKRQAKNDFLKDVKSTVVLFIYIFLMHMHLSHFSFLFVFFCLFLFLLLLFLFTYLSNIFKIVEIMLIRINKYDFN